MTGPTPPDRRRSFEVETYERIREIESQLEDGGERMERIEAKVDEVYDIVVTAKGFFKVLGAIGVAVKWIMLMASALAAAWAAFRYKG